MKLHLESTQIYFELIISRSIDELHCSLIVHMNHIEPMFQDLPFFAPRRSQKTTINFVTFVTGVELTSWCFLRPLEGSAARTGTGALSGAGQSVRGRAHLARNDGKMSRSMQLINFAKRPGSLHLFCHSQIAVDVWKKSIYILFY